MGYTRKISYEVLITPLIDKDAYGDVIDVTEDIDLSDYIKDGGIGSINREIDNGDYDIGIFTFGDITLKAINIDGKFNHESDWRSIFQYTRDRAKVKINFYDNDNNNYISFNGMINEEGTRQDLLKDEVSFKVLSQDSIFRKVKVSGGTIGNGTLFSTAIKRILNVPEITSILTYDDTKINVGYDSIIDNATYFDNKSTKDVLDALMLVSSSIMLIDANNVMTVKNRTENTGNAFYFYGEGDTFGRENIINIKNYNTGLHRTFNSVILNNYEQSDRDFIEVFGLRQKKLDYTFITNELRARAIAQNIVTEFKAPKLELELETPTEVAKTLNLLDLVAIDYNYIRKPYGSYKLPIYGVSKYGSAAYPYIQGNIKISPQLAFKVIGINEDPKNFTTTIKLRQRGVTLDDGIFAAFQTVYGQARYGVSPYSLDADRVNPSYRANYGAGQYGVTRYGSIL